MKLNKLIFGAAMMTAALSCASAQAALHGKVDFVNNCADQEFSKTTGAEKWDASDVKAGFDADSSTTVDLKLNAANFEFNLGMKLNSSAGDEKYTDYTDAYDGTPFYQGNMKIGFWTDQINVYTGKFEDFNAGYIEDGYAMGTQNISNLASSGQGQHFTAINISPFSVPALRGLNVLVGLPILPVNGNGVNYLDSNSWYVKDDEGKFKYSLAQKVKAAVSYEIPELVKVNAGFRPGTYYTGVKSYDVDGNFLKNYYSEGYIQACFPSLVEGLAFNLSYDIRYRKAEYTNRANETTEKTALAHMGAVSAEYAVMENLTLACEDRFFFAGDDYAVVDDKVLADVLALNVNYILNERWSFGAGLAGFYAVDARGTALAANGDYFDGFDFDDFGFSYLGSLAVTEGKSNQYVGVYANPYAKLSVSSGDITLGVKVEYGFATDGSGNNMKLSYAVPVGFKFVF